MTDIAADGTAYEWQGEGPPVALVHGLGLDRRSWQWQLPALVGRNRVLTYDLYGHGESAPPPDEPSLTLFSRQLADLLEGTGVSACAVVGFSLGGMIARRFAMDHPQKLTALAVLHSAHARTQAQRDAILQRVEQAAKDGPSATAGAALERWFSEAYRDTNPDVMEMIRRCILSNDPEVYPKIYRVLAEGDAEIARPIEAIAVPTLVMTGGEDHGNSPAMAEAMARAIPNAHAVVLPGLRHMALAEDPDLFNRHLVGFLDAAIGRRAALV